MHNLYRTDILYLLTFITKLKLREWNNNINTHLICVYNVWFGCWNYGGFWYHLLFRYIYVTPTWYLPLVNQLNQMLKWKKKSFSKQKCVSNKLMESLTQRLLWVNKRQKNWRTRAIKFNTFLTTQNSCHILCTCYWLVLMMFCLVFPLLI